MVRLQKISTSIGQTLQNISDWVLGAVRRIFSPSDDEYPKTGVQPFEGDIPDTN
ncbi:MAG: hypothetical protein AAFV72_12890 [Cyanobacteria bacterium J06635_1]